MTHKLQKLLTHPITIPLLLILTISSLFYQFFLKGLQPFPADLLVGSYLPWLDYHKMPVKNPLISDVFSQLYLWKYMAIESFRIGQFPLWNPYSFAGTPLLANFQSAVLNPFSILLFLPKELGWGLFIFLQPIVAAVSMYLLLKQFIKSPLALFLGSIIFALGGTMTTWLELGTAVYAMSYLPLALFVLTKYLSSNKIRFLIFLPIIIACSVFSGNVQITIFTLMAVTLFSILAPSSITGSRKKTIVIILLFQLFGLLLSSIQLIPSLYFLQDSIRGADNFIKEDNFGLLPIYELIKFFNADFFGHPSTRNYYGFLNYFETSLYLGSLSLLFIIFYCKNRVLERINIYFLLLLFLSLIISFNNPISQLIYVIQIPLLTQSYASRSLFLFIFAASFIIARGAEMWIQEKDLKKLLSASILSSSILIGIFLGILISYSWFNQNLLTIENKEVLTEFFKWDTEASAIINKVAFRNTLIPISINLFILFALLTILSIKRYIKKIYHPVFLHLLTAIILLIWIIDLGRYFLKFNPFTPTDLLYPQTPITQFLTDKSNNELFRIAREHGEVMPPNTWIAYHLSTLDGYDPLHTKQISNFINFINTENFEENNSTRFAEIGSHYNSQMIKNANIKYIIGILRTPSGEIGGDQISHELKDFKVAFQDKSTVILENPDVKPRFYFAKKYQVLSRNEIKSKISDKNVDSDETTFIEPTKNLLPTISGDGLIEVVSYTPNNVIVKTKTSQNELLVFADQFDNGWKATINNQPKELLKANLVFRALEIPKGEHTVTFSYKPFSFILGLWISLITSIMLILFAIVMKKKSKW